MDEIVGPTEHPISFAKAKELLRGDLADCYRKILMECCAPIYWYKRNSDQLNVLQNGTLTFVKTPKMLLGITAAHVLRGLERDNEKYNITVQLANETINTLLYRVIDISDTYDLATIAIDENLLSNLGKITNPLESWPPKSPQEGRGILIAGYPEVSRIQLKNEVNFGLFTALVIARTVTDIQITWVVERESQLDNVKIKPPPYNYNLSGISGGPLIGLFESKSYLLHYCLSGIVTEQPNSENSDFTIERLVAVRADLICDDGSMRKCR